MKNIFIIFLSLSFILIDCCKRTPEPTDKDPSLINLDVIIPTSTINKYSDLFSETKIINLATTNDCLIREIKSLRVIGNDIYIQNDDGFNVQLFRFDIEGNFLNQIGTYGRGPEEILSVRDFYFENDTLEVWSTLNISQFSKEGKYIKKVFNAYYPGVGFFKDSGYYYLFHSSAKPWIVTKHKSNGKQVKEYLPYNYVDARSHYDKVISFNNQVSLFMTHNDYVYTFSMESIIPKAYFNRVGMSSGKEYLKNSKNFNEYLKRINSDKGYCRINNYFENEYYIFFEYLNNRKMYYSLFDKSSSNSLYFTKEIKDDINGLEFSCPICLTDNNYFIIPVLINPNNSKSEKVDSIEEFKMYHNPSLIFCKLKR